MLRHVVGALLIPVAVLLLAAAGRAAEGSKMPDAEVTVTGESAHSFEEAKQEALRQAVEKGAGVNVFADTRAQDFRLMHDTIISRAAGYVRRYDVIGQEEAGNVYKVTVHAVVAVGAISDDWGALEVLRRRKGWPNILIVVEEKTRVLGSLNAAEYKLRDAFEKLGFDIVDDKTLAAGAEGDKTRAAIVGDPAKAAALAVQLHAGYAVIGESSVSQEPAVDVGGVYLVPADADVSVRIVAADSGYLLASKSGRARRTGADLATAARAALEDAAAIVAADAIPRMLEHWSKDIDVGGTFNLEGTRIDTEVLDALIERLRTLDGVKAATIVSHNEQLSTVKVVSRLEPTSLAREIPTLSGGRLAVTEISPGKIGFMMKTEKQQRDDIVKSAPPGAVIAPTTVMPAAPSPARPVGAAPGSGGITISTPTLILGLIVIGLVIALIAAKRK